MELLIVKDKRNGIKVFDKICKTLWECDVVSTPPNPAPPPRIPSLCFYFSLSPLPALFRTALLHPWSLSRVRLPLALAAASSLNHVLSLSPSFTLALTPTHALSRPLTLSNALLLFLFPSLSLQTTHTLSTNFSL